jgi:hypothetical protein
MLEHRDLPAANAATSPTAGWRPAARHLEHHPRGASDHGLPAVNKYIYFFTESPASGTSGGSCPPPLHLQGHGRSVRLYTMWYFANGNTIPPVTDRAASIPNASFATNPIFYISADQSGNVAFTTNHGAFTPNKTVEPTRSNIKDWKEN